MLFATIILAATTATLNAQSALKRGNAFWAQENYKAAIEEYRRVSTNDANSYARAIYNIGVCHYELWQTEEAIIFYKRAIQLKHGNYPRASYALGVALEDQGQLAEAKQAYEQARNNFAPAIHKLGMLEARSGELRKAADLFRDAASRKCNHVPASHNNLGVMLARLGLLQEAEKSFIVALKESNNRLDEADHNLKLCRSLMLSTRLRNSDDFRLLNTD
ncbi:MAG TPA: tetratricopeptide repeat protein [Pyrinomonadaceae bacterium]|nr:tetratricopeptide repeat protein [Pyrinomonadaceae bacterium]